MRLDILTIPECPNGALAEERTRAALARLGEGAVDVRVRELASDAEAAAALFSGSPTILRDGVDLFLGTRAATLACRVYPGEQGGAPSGAPSVAQIEAALRGHARD